MSSGSVSTSRPAPPKKRQRDAEKTSQQASQRTSQRTDGIRSHQPAHHQPDKRQPRQYLAGRFRPRQRTFSPEKSIQMFFSVFGRSP